MYEWINLNKWIYVIVIWDGYVIMFYVNGEECDGYFFDFKLNMFFNMFFVESVLVFMVGNFYFKNYQFFGVIMDLYIFGIVLFYDNVIEVYRGEIYQLRFVKIIWLR